MSGRLTASATSPADEREEQGASRGRLRKMVGIFSERDIIGPRGRMNPMRLR